MLNSINEAARLLGGISHWTLRKNAAAGRLRVVRIGRRVFLDTEEIERIRREGLPSLRFDAKKVAKDEKLGAVSVHQD